LGNKAANTHVAIHSTLIEEINNDLNVSLYASWKDTWMIDSGTTHHITPHASDFSSYSKIKGAVRLGDKSTVAQEGTGTVTIKTSKGYTIMLSNVLHVPMVNTCFMVLAHLRPKEARLSSLVAEQRS